MEEQSCCSKTNGASLGRTASSLDLRGVLWLPLRLWVYGMGTACRLWRLLGVTRARVFYSNDMASRAERLGSNAYHKAF
jgi:hypothetical protein